MHDATALAADLLGLDPCADRSAIRHAFRNAVRQGRPDLGAMSGERLGQLIAARDELLAAAPVSVRPAGHRESPVAEGRPAHGRWVDPTDRPAAGRLVDVYA